MAWKSQENLAHLASLAGTFYASSWCILLKRVCSGFGTADGQAQTTKKTERDIHL